MRSLIAFAVLLCTTGTLAAQVVLNTDPYGSSGINSRNIVRDSSGVLWALSVSEDGSGNRPLLLQRSMDSGATWSVEPFTFNDASSGLNPPNAANQCALCIDSTGRLHATWGRYYYPSYYQQYYANYDPTTATGSPIVNVGGLTNASAGSRTAAMDIIADAGDTIYLVAQGPSSWVEQLLQSTAPSAAGGTFNNLGNISPSASSQSTKLAVDANGLVHTSFYRNTGAGNYEHRIYDPLNGWAATTTVLGNTTPTNDYYGLLAADALGNVHALYVMDAYTTSTWQFSYNVWNATTGWSTTPTPLFSATTGQYSGTANYIIFSLAAEAATGKVSVVYRDLSNGGSLRHAEKNLPDTAFTVVGDIMPPVAGLHEYYIPTIRGTLYPAFNNTMSDLDVTWRQGAAPGPYSFVYYHVGPVSPPVSITLAAPAVIGGVTAVNCSSPTDAGKPFVCGFAAGDTPGIMLSDARVIPLNPDVLLQFSLTPGNGVFFNNVGVLDNAGFASPMVILPNLPVLQNMTFYAAFVVADPLNPTGVGTISPSLPITVM